MNLISSYTKALIVLSKEENIEEEFSKNVDDFLELLTINKEFNYFIRNNVYTFNEKLEVLELLNDFFGEYFLNFIKVLIKDKNQKNLISILKAYKIEKELEQNIIRGKIFTAYELSSEKISILETKFSKMFNKTILLTAEIDKTLISGIRVQVQDRVFDYSIKEELNQIKERLIQK